MPQIESVLITKAYVEMNGICFSLARRSELAFEGHWAIAETTRLGFVLPYLMHELECGFGQARLVEDRNHL